MPTLTPIVRPLLASIDAAAVFYVWGHPRQWWSVTIAHAAHLALFSRGLPLLERLRWAGSWLVSERRHLRSQGESLMDAVQPHEVSRTRTISAQLTPPAVPTVLVQVYLDKDNVIHTTIAPVLALSLRRVSYWKKVIQGRIEHLPDELESRADLEADGWTFEHYDDDVGYVVDVDREGEMPRIWDASVASPVIEGVSTYRLVGKLPWWSDNAFKSEVEDVADELAKVVSAERLKHGSPFADPPGVDADDLNQQEEHDDEEG